ncbi:MAG: LPS-assembly protein LptD [Alphaproteobacteria bacterium]|nr:LPS-assembly protein LptD [Alphaproteobacteria bacterium]
MSLVHLKKSFSRYLICGTVLCGCFCITSHKVRADDIEGGSGSLADMEMSDANNSDLVGVISGATSFSDEDFGKVPISFSADVMSYDKENDIATVMGNVEAIHAGHTLNADTVSYSRTENSLIASGNVKLMRPDGTTMFAEYAELSGDMKSGLINALKLLLVDESHITADKAEKIAGKGTSFTKATFSACKACEENPDKELFWRLRADKVFYNEKIRDIEYTNVWLDVFGTPVMYFPYFSHPSPEVKRRSGFLSPNIANTTSLGATIQTPYYWEISEHKDLTITPMYTSDEGAVFIANYRQMFTAGELDLTGSITEDSRNNLRNHIDLSAKAAINNNWRASLDVERASDDTYLKKYNFDDSPWLTSKAQVEGFFGKTYASIKGYSFQELRSTVGDNEPIVAPAFDLNYVGTPGEYGEQWKTDLNSMVITQDEGPDSVRFSAQTLFEVPYYMPRGDIYSLSASLRGDFYAVNDVERDDGTLWSGLVGRAHPQLSLKWRYPFVKVGGDGSRQVIEPIVEAVAAPNGNNSDKIPNQDSRDLEFDDTNVLGDNKFSGLDRVESGSRLNYGVKWNYYGQEAGSASVFVGQSYHFSKDNLFPDESGLDKNFSDFVGRVDLSPHEKLDLSYRFRIDTRGMDARLHEIYLNTGTEDLNLSLDYMFVNASTQEFTGYDDREEVGAKINMKLAELWYGGLYGRHDLTSDGGAVEYGGHIKYKDECVELGVDVERSYTEDRDYEGGLSVMFTIILKNLGGVSGNS